MSQKAMKPRETAGLFGSGKPPDDPPKSEQEGSNRKHSKTRRIAPCLVNVPPEIQERPEQQSSGPKVLRRLGRLSRNRWKALAFRRRYLCIRYTKSLGGRPEQINSFAEKRQAT